MVTRRSLLAAGAARLALIGDAQAQGAAAYPDRAIRFICSASVGGGNDLIARIAGERLQRRWRQPVIVENKPGAGNNLATEYVYRAAPDGYTMLVSPPASLTVNAVLFKDLRFDPTKIAPVSITSYIPNVLVVNAESRFKTAQELIAYAKANPGSLAYASQGVGTTGHLTAALFETLTGARQNHAPYGGSAPALNDVAAGHVDFMFADIGTVFPLWRGGLVRILAATGRERLAIAPDVPTAAEVGLPDLLSDTWTAFTAPPDTPLDIRQTMSAALKEIIFDPAVVAQLRVIGVVPWGLDPAQSADLIARETKRWTEVVRIAGITAQ